MTCNPKWKELKDVLKKFLIEATPNDIPNITVRLFHTKFLDLLYDITQNEIFGSILAHVYTIEFQKRGLPHVHLLVTLHPNNKLITPEAIDRHISAEIPSDNNILQKLVIKHMLHGPHTESSPCYDQSKDICKKKFSKTIPIIHIIKQKGYPQYKRIDNSSDNHKYRRKTSKQIIPVNNPMVVLYNKFFFAKI